MSLVAWFPLNGNLADKGLSNYTLTNSNATVDNNGKIGKCYYFNDSYLRFPDPIKNTNTEFSIAIWFKTTDASAQQCIYNGRTTAGKSVAIFIIGSKIRFDDDNQHTDTLTLSSNVWYHLVCTYKKNDKKCIYLNGIKRLETNASSALSKTNNYATIGMSSSNDGTPKSNVYKGYFNDFRIYSHALTETEVQELAKGLIAHYRLTGNGNPNLCNDTNIGWTRKTITGYNTLYRDTNFFGLNVGDTYTYSIKLKSISGKRVYARVEFYTDSSNRTSIYSDKIITNGTSDYCVITSTLTETQKTYNHMRLCVHLVGNDAGDNAVFEFCEVKLEKGSTRTPWIPNSENTKYTGMGYNSLVEEDCSGYGNKGTKSEVFDISLNSPMNESCYVFDTDNSKITNTWGYGINCLNKTFSVWVKPLASLNDKQIFAFANGTNQRLYVGGKNNTYNLSFESTAWGRTTKAAVVLNEWTFITVTIDSAGLCKLYKNGEFIESLQGSNTGFNFNSNINIGGNPNYTSNCCLSDLRIYATALTQAQIIELYEKRNNIF